MPIVAGVFGVVAGAAVLIQGFLRQDAPSAEETFLFVGVLVLGTGLTKVVSGMLADEDPIRQQNGSLCHVVPNVGCPNACPPSPSRRRWP